MQGTVGWSHTPMFSLTGKVAESRGAESNSVSFIRQEGLNAQLYPYATVAIEERKRRERDLVSLLGAGSLQLHTGVWECREEGQVLAGVFGHAARNGTQVPACNWGHLGRLGHGEGGGCSTSRGTTG